MIKENQKAFVALHILGDAVLLALSVPLAYAVRFALMEGVDAYAGSSVYWLFAIVSVVVFLFLYGMNGLYDFSPTRGINQLTKQLEKVILSNLIGTAILLALLFVARGIDISRWMLVFFFGISTVLICLNRILLRSLLRHYQKKGYHRRAVLIVGSNDTARRYYKTISENAVFGLQPIGQIGGDIALDGLSHLGDFERLPEILEQNQVDEVVAALSQEESQYITQVILDCETAGVKLSVIPYYADLMSTHPYIDDLGGLPLMNIRRIPLDNYVNAVLKRAMDIVGAAVLIVLTSPIMLVAAIGTKLSSPGPVIFKQVRVGQHKKEFVMYKFRSMRVNDSQDTGWSRDKDSRKTKFGALLRKCSIDELPQFFNVLKGDMSLVGPRPEVPHYVNQFKSVVPLYMVKHQVRPGITGWAQVNGLRGDTSIEDRIRHDLFYIENWSLLFDIKILFLTVSKALVNSEKLV